MELLIKAVKNNEIDIVKSYLDNGFNINKKNKKGNTILMYQSSIDMMRLLINYGIDVNLKNKLGMTSLMYEVIKGDCVEKIQLLIRSGANIHLKNNDKNTLLMLSLKNGNMNIIKLFNHIKINIKNKNGYNAFMYAVLHNKPNVMEHMEWLLSRGAYINTSNKKGVTPLIISIRNQNIEIVSWLLQHGANVNKKCKRRSPLTYAVSYDNIDIVKLLLAYNAKGKNTLKYAVDNNKYENVKLLLEYECSVQSVCNAFMMAIKRGYIDMIQLIYHDDLLEIKDMNGYTPLLLVVKSAVYSKEDSIYLHVAQFLLEKGANVHVLDNEGNDAFYWACYNMNKNMVALLMHHGSKINHTKVPPYYKMYKILVTYMMDEELYSANKLSNLKETELKYVIKELSYRRYIQKKKIQYYERVLKYIPEHNAVIRYKIGNMGYKITKFDFDKEITQDIVDYLGATPENIQMRVNEYLYQH